MEWKSEQRCTRIRPYIFQFFMQKQFKLHQYEFRRQCKSSVLTVC
jgi:hypothetical protein